MLSPSSPYVGIPLRHRYSSKAKLMVVLPAPERPERRRILYRVRNHALNSDINEDKKIKKISSEGIEIY